MANTQKTLVVGVTGASGINGLTGLKAALGTAVDTAIAGITGTTGINLNSIQIGNPPNIIQDANTGTFQMFTAVNYVVTS